jgi:hypothetical protein
MKNRGHTCPKTHQKLFLSPFFGVKIGHFSLFFAIVCDIMSCTNLRQQLRRAEWSQWFFTCMEQWLALVSPSQLLAQKSYGQNAVLGLEIMERGLFWLQIAN